MLLIFAADQNCQGTELTTNKSQICNSSTFSQRRQVKVDSMWQHRLTRPLHVPGMYSIRITVYFVNKIHLTLFQEGARLHLDGFSVKIILHLRE